MRTLNDYFLTAEIEDISTASSTFVRAGLSLGNFQPIFGASIWAPTSA